MLIWIVPGFAVNAFSTISNYESEEESVNENKESRFEIDTERQDGSLIFTSILTDRETGCKYLSHQEKASGGLGGLTELKNKEGNSYCSDME